MPEVSVQHTLPTSDYEVDAFHIARIVWILDSVNPLISLSHHLYDQVRLIAVEFGPVVWRHSAVAHQDDVVPLTIHRVLERHLERDGGQRDVEILSEEQSDLFIICTREQQKDDGVNLGQNL